MPQTHPLSQVSITIKHFKSFGETPCGYGEFQPINVIIGRNNTGKSALIDAVELCISGGKFFDPQRHARDGKPFSVEVTQPLDEATLRNVFPEHIHGGGIPGQNHWVFGQHLLGIPITRRYAKGWKPELLNNVLTQLNPDHQPHYLAKIAEAAYWPFHQLNLLRIAAERDVEPEGRLERSLSPNGEGITNLVRSFIMSDDLPRSEVEQGLLSDLNTVYSGDSEFKRILCQENENDQTWELFLEEEHKGDIRLSQSGSSLKSVFLILCTLRLLPKLKNIDLRKVVLAVEEPENNLHPALLRRLLDFLATEREAKEFTLVITTHSPIAIDWSSRRDDSQIIHVRHNGEEALTSVASQYQDTRQIIEDLDIRASDILQANGIIWVEGPSDRIYLKKWIELASEGNLREGTHFTIMFYGGKLLYHLDALPPDKSEKLVSLLSINKNAAVLIDSDRHLGSAAKKQKPRMNLNSTKRRIKDELEESGSFVWITEGREVENYVPIEVFATISGKKPPKINAYTKIIDLPLLKQFNNDKVSIAHDAVRELTIENYSGMLDLNDQLNSLCSRIRAWNGIK
jgi:putative ATP-dependent endonuclease of OLD family